MGNADQEGSFLIEQLSQLDDVTQVRGKGLMIGVEFEYPIANLRNSLVQEFKVITGNASQPNTLRLLPPLNITHDHSLEFLEKLKLAIANLKVA